MHRCVHLLGITWIHLHSKRRKHSVDAFHLGVVEGTNLAPVARLNYFGDLVEVGADVLMDSGAGGAVLRLATHDTKKSDDGGLGLSVSSPRMEGKHDDTVRDRGR